MANQKRFPMKGDRVTTPKIKNVFLVVDVKENPRLADIRLVNGTLLLRNIPWTMLTFLDEEPHV